MTNFSLKDTSEYYIELTENPKRFDPYSPVNNVFFDDTNGQVFTVRSGGVTGVSVIGMDDSKCTSFRMEDKGSIVSIKFSVDHKILAIQRNRENQNATVEFMNFKDLQPTNVEYSHTCKWKSAKILGFVWSKVNEIAYITDHGIELLQVVPEKKQLKSLKNSTFSGAWFSWCPQSKIVLLASNNGALVQPFSLNGSTITKLNKLELEAARPVAERDVFVLRLCNATWCAVFRHGAAATANATGPTEVLLMPITGPPGTNSTHILKTGLVGRFAVSVVDDLIIVHHQSSQTSLVFDIMEDTKTDSSIIQHIPIVPGATMKPASIGDQPCPMYSDNWVVFQPNFMIDARLGCLWQVKLNLPGLAHSLPKEEVPKIVAVLLRRSDSKDTIYNILNQLVAEAEIYMNQLSKSFDEVNRVYRKWADLEVARNTAGQASPRAEGAPPRVVLTQADICSRVLLTHTDDKRLVQVVTAYVSSLSRFELRAEHEVAELCVRALATRGPAARARLRAMVRRGCLADSRPLACQLLSLGHIDPAAAQLALDMMWRLKAYEEVVEVLLSWGQAVAAAGVARTGGTWATLPARKLLDAAAPRHLAPLLRTLTARNERLRGDPRFLRGEQCDVYVELYNKFMSQ